VNTARVRKFECLGGPLCGQRRAKADGLCYSDPDGKTHFYRLIRVAKNDFSAIATFFHYFGINGTIAADAHPRMTPPERLFKAKRSR
jgi:hypothetical protein